MDVGSEGYALVASTSSSSAQAHETKMQIGITNSSHVASNLLSSAEIQGTLDQEGDANIVYGIDSLMQDPPTAETAEHDVEVPSSTAQEDKQRKHAQWMSMFGITVAPERSRKPESDLLMEAAELLSETACHSAWRSQRSECRFRGC